ncbi:MAG: peptidylprolyl isomerase [Myxococcota bacterium]
MTNKWMAVLVAVGIVWSCKSEAKNPRVVFETTKGKIVIELDKTKAPLSTANMIEYVKAGFYDGTIFHRVIPGFMIQGGGFSAELHQKATRPPIKNEAQNGLKNLRGTLSMARTGVVDSATSQFFINVVDNPRLDHTSPDARGFGYAVFAKVVEGMEVVDAIRDTKTLCPSTVPVPCDAPLPPGMRDVPAEPVIITHASLQ